MAIFPGAVATDAGLYVAVNNLSTLLTDNPLTIGATTVNVVSTTGFPTAGAISIGAEIIFYTGTTATSFTGCTRGADGTSAAAHALNDQVDHNGIAFHHNALKDEIIAIESYISTHIGLLTTVTATEFERLSGVTSPIQTQLDGKEPTITVLPVSKGGTNSGAALSNNRIIRSLSGAIVEAAAITANRALASDASGIPVHTVVTDTELGHLSGVTSSIQTQLNTKATDSLVVHLAGTETITGQKTMNALIATLAANLAAGGFKITGLAAGSANGDSLRFEQNKIIQIVSATSTTQTDTTSTSFVDTALSATITPTSASNKIRITISSGRNISGASNSLYSTIKRGGTDLGGSNGLAQNGSAGGTGTTGPCHISYVDSPATTSPTTYTLRIRSSGGATVTHGDGNITNTIILEEIVS